MFTGELEFSNISFNSSPVLGYLVFLLFLFLIVIVLMNLLTGLAVGETSKIRDEAEVWAQRCRVETIFHLETCLVSLSAWMPSFIHPRLFSMSGHLLLPSGQSTLPHCLTVQPNARGEIPCCRSKTLPLPLPLSSLDSSSGFFSFSSCYLSLISFIDIFQKVVVAKICRRRSSVSVTSSSVSLVKPGDQ